MGKWFKYFLTPGSDNEWDIGYILWCVTVIEFIYKTWTAVNFDPTSFSIGAAGILAAGAGLQWHANTNFRREQP